MDSHDTGSDETVLREVTVHPVVELRAQLQAVTGGRIATLEGIGEMKQVATGKNSETARVGERTPRDIAGPGRAKEPVGTAAPRSDRDPAVPERGKGGGGMDLGL